MFYQYFPRGAEWKRKGGTALVEEWMYPPNIPLILGTKYYGNWHI
jgi:hypothetical protein